MGKGIVKFNGGAGAILCNGCKVIIKEHLAAEEWDAATKQENFCVYCSDSPKEPGRVVATLKKDKKNG
jgi:hypothetical protein